MKTNLLKPFCVQLPVKGLLAAVITCTAAALSAQNVSVNTDGTSGPGLFNVGNTTTPPFQVMPNGQVLGWASGTAGAPSYSFVGNGSTGMFRPGTDILGFSTASTERLRILANGNVVVAGTSTNARFEAVGPATGSGVAIQAGGGGDVLLNSGGSLFFDGNYSYAGGNYIRPLAANTQGFFTAGTERMRIAPNGNISMGMAGTAGGYGLELGGSFGYGNGTAGSYRSRTETRNDAGQIASQSGFFETSAPAPAANWYNGASGWQHLLDVRHSNNSNNYAMQFAGSFFDQRLYFRKTNGNANQSWSEIMVVPVGNAASSNNAWNLSSNIAYSPDDISGASVLSGDDATVNYTMPFSLTIDGVAYNVITISTNGWISFANPGSSYTGNNTLPSSFFSAPTIFPYWDDLVTNGSNIRYFSSGTAPNRAVIVDYECRTYTGSYNVRFQVTIHETSGLINVQYRDEMNPSANGQSATIGFQMAGGASAKAFPIISDGKILDDNRDNNSGWSISPVR